MKVGDRKHRCSRPHAVDAACLVAREKYGDRGVVVVHRDPASGEVPLVVRERSERSESQ